MCWQRRHSWVDFRASRMLKKSSSGVFASFRSSTYPSGYASALHSLRPCWTRLLSILQDRVLLFQRFRLFDFPLGEHVFP